MSSARARATSASICSCGGAAGGCGARDGVRGDECASVVFHPVDAVGVRSEAPDAGLRLQTLRQTEAKLAGPAAASRWAARNRFAEGDRRFAPAQQHTWTLECTLIACGGTRECAVHLPDVPRLAFDVVTQHVRSQTSSACGICGGVE